MSEQVAAKLMKASVGRICEGEGVQYAQQSALNLLMHLAIDHVTKVSTGAKESAEASGRMVVNVADVAMSLIELGEELPTLQEFADDSKGKTNLKPLVQVPRFPIYPPMVLPSPDPLDRIEPFPVSVPQHLPPFPPAYTYMRTDVVATRVEGAFTGRKRALESATAGDVLLDE